MVYKYGHVIGAMKCQHSTSYGISHFLSVASQAKTNFNRAHIICWHCIVHLATSSGMENSWASSIILNYTW